MKHFLKREEVIIPEGVEVTAKRRIVTIKGPRGLVEKNFRHAAVDIRIETIKGIKKLVIEMWFGTSRNAPLVTTIATRIKNAITGVTKGHLFIMKAAYVHFPIKVIVTNEGKTLGLKNFLGGREVYEIKLLPGCTALMPSNRESQWPSNREPEWRSFESTLEISGIDLENVSMTCAIINQALKEANRKDDRKFLDGCYVQKRTTIDRT